MSAFQPSDELAFTGAVLNTVAERTGTDVLELPPIYDAIDPDALEAVLGHANGGGDCRVEFSYHGYQVTVTGAGEVSLDSDVETAVA